MQIITDLNFQRNNTAICIGKFDGIHRGHRLLISEAARSGFLVAMITFAFPGAETIYSEEEKIFLAESLGIDLLIVLPVTEAFMHMGPDEFVREILVKRCGARLVVVGADFRFGYQRAGTAAYLEEAGKRRQFSVKVYDKLKKDGQVISSTRIRSLLREGEMEKANDLLQTPYFIRGTVEPGNHLGRTMEVPTANIRPAEGKVLPPRGVYAVRATMENGECYDGVGNLGVKPTVSSAMEQTEGLEVWLFGYQGNLYGQRLTVSLLHYQRPERKFSSLEELAQQIQKDTDEAKAFLWNR